MIVALEKFLAEAGWVERFEDEARLIGGRLVSKVQELKLEGEDEITAQASVLGEKVEATFWPQGGQMLFETSCSCEAGAFCEHGFALIGKMAKTKHLEKCVGLTAKQAVAVELARGEGGRREGDGESGRAGENVTFELVVRKDVVDKAMSSLESSEHSQNLQATLKMLNQ